MFEFWGFGILGFEILNLKFVVEEIVIVWYYPRIPFCGKFSRLADFIGRAVSRSRDEG